MSINGKEELPSTRRTSNRALWNIGIGLLLVALAVFVYLGYGWEWTGFQGNTLFHWLQILVSASIPVAVAIGTFYLNREAKKRDDKDQHERERLEKEAQKAHREREQAIETRREEEASLQAYLDRISQMLLEQDLQKATLGDHLSTVARAHTLTVLRRLEDGERKSSVLQFLYEVDLIDRTHPVVNLRGADLRGADLLGADRHADRQALLGSRSPPRLADVVAAFRSGANLRGAYLQGANLQAANCRSAELQEADLRDANLRDADLLSAHLEGADLRGAVLRGARNLKQHQIDQAIGSDLTTLPEGINRPKSWSVRSTDE